VGLAVVVLAFLAAPFPAFAPPPSGSTWVASGTFRYQDREWDSSGFTGVIVERPVRFADVEVLDANASGKKALLAMGKTDANGFFTIEVSDSKTRTVYVRGITRSKQTSDLHVEVETHGGSPYAVASAEVPNHDPSTNVDFGIMVAAVGGGGEAFNMFDLLVYGADFIAHVEGKRPDKRKLVTVKWEIDGGVTGAAWTSGKVITMRDYAAYDDTVVLHEWSHYVMNMYSGSANPGGTHFLADCDEKPRLSFDEGRASAFGCKVRRYFGMPNANIYIRTTGAAGPGGLQNGFDLEDEVQYACDGTTSEVTVARGLWDISDDAATTDTTPGIEESHDLLGLPDSEVWEVHSGTLGWPYTFEQFWDGWFEAGNGYLLEMRGVMGFLGIDYDEDAYEPNDSAAGAASIAPDGSLVSLTFFSDPDGDGIGQVDDDYFTLDVVSGVGYEIETLDLLSGADTLLELVDSDGSTVLASNDDRSGSDPSSWISWTAPRTDTFYVRVQNVAADVDYGSYTLTASIP
jgi:hypothetical protein